jgi:signal transduction histidine kinase
MNQKSLQMSVLVGTVSVIVVTGLLMVLLVKIMLPGKFLTILEEKTIAQARLVASDSANPLITEQFFELRMKLNELKISDESIAYAFIIDSHDGVAAHTFQQGFPSELKTANRVAPGEKQSVRQLVAGGERFLDVALPVLGGSVGELHIGTFLTPVEQGVNRITAVIIWIIVGTSAAGGMTALILARRKLRPLSELGHAIESFGRGDMFQLASPGGQSNEIGQLIALFNRMAEDIRRSRDEREQSQKFLISLINGVTEQILVIRPDFTVLMSNKAEPREAGNVYCYNLLHRRNAPCYEQGEICPLREIMRTKKSLTATHTHIRSDGSKYIEEISASPFLDENGELLYVIEVCRDITEKQKLMEMKSALDKKIAEHQKEESISTLAGGIAHEFNNILMGVMGNAELLLIQSDPNGKERALAENIIHSAERMAYLTNHMLAYAKGGMYQPSLIHLNKAISEALDMTRKGRYQHIDTRLIPAEDLWPVFGDPQQIHQVMTNLITNAFEAVEDNGGGLTVQTLNEADKPAWVCLSFNHEHTAGDYVHVVVSDTGAGIPPEHVKRIFEPFFSTKFIGRGLGLAAVSGIIQNHRGCISVRSEAGRGSTFDIYLPRGITAQKEIREGQVLPLPDTSRQKI